MEILLILCIIYGVYSGKQKLKETHEGVRPGVQPAEENTWVFGIFDV